MPIPSREFTVGSGTGLDMVADSQMSHLQRALLVLLFLSGDYLYTFPSATIAFGSVVLLHLLAGLILLWKLLPVLPRLLRGSPTEARWGWLFLAAGGALGVVLILTGTPRPMRGWLFVHIGLSLSGVLLLIAAWVRARGWFGSSTQTRLLRYAVLLPALAMLVGSTWWIREVRWQRAYRIENPRMPPATMDGEGDGAGGAFFPSSAQTVHGGKIPAKFFMQSQACQRCHADIYEQWSSSAHRFSSFNNQWYRKSVEYMQDVAGVRESKWCAGCHDPALLFSGMFDTPIREQIDRPEAHAGMACVMCHSIVSVKSTMGQGDYVIEYPTLHELAASENPVVRALHDFLVKVNPEPHRRTFLKPFVRRQTAEFCSTCHKVHLDVPVNHYRWVRGFDEYDNWQASGVSGQGARSFYYPAKAQKCADCHMPLVPSRDAGNINGFVHSHRFPAANTALPIANQDSKQLEVTEQFLKDKVVSVDIFAMSPALPLTEGGEVPGAQVSTTFAVGEEAEMTVPRATLETLPVTAPLNRIQGVVRRGDAVRVDVVVRSRKVGHFFPGGTVDAFDCWLELRATDEKEQVLFWSGRVEDDGKGPVEKGAHFYRSLMIDAHGNPINKRNAWATRAVVYVRLIPPGAADTVHYLLRIPETAGDRIQLRARLNYRKFSWWNTQFSFAGTRDSKQTSPAVTSEYDDGRWVFTGSTDRVSGKLKQIPVLPIVTMAEDTVALHTAPRSAPSPQAQLVLVKEDRDRWNDYGIGLLLQGDLRGADSVFRTVTEIDPQNPDGWVNLGRVHVQEGNLAGARQVLEKALSLPPDLARAHFFYARVLKEEGQYDEANQHLRRILGNYPRDRVVRDELGRVLFLQRRYAEAVKEFEQVLSIDPEDLQAHYNLMLCYNGLGQPARAREHQTRYLRFKADEAAQAITGAYRRNHSEDNNERQAIHQHVSAPLETPVNKPRRAGHRRAQPKLAAAAH
jgi:tetratricopeptide (TPR) repeat protein